MQSLTYTLPSFNNFSKILKSCFMASREFLGIYPFSYAFVSTNLAIQLTTLTFMFGALSCKPSFTSSITYSIEIQNMKSFKVLKVSSII